jgi:hypothetical protein
MVPLLYFLAYLAVLYAGIQWLQQQKYIHPTNKDDETQDISTVEEESEGEGEGEEEEESEGEEEEKEEEEEDTPSPVEGLVH